MAEKTKRLRRGSSSVSRKDVMHVVKTQSDGFDVPGVKGKRPEDSEKRTIVRQSDLFDLEWKRAWRRPCEKSGSRLISARAVHPGTFKHEEQRNKEASALYAPSSSSESCFLRPVPSVLFSEGMDAGSKAGLSSCGLLAEVGGFGRNTQECIAWKVVKLGKNKTMPGENGLTNSSQGKQNKVAQLFVLKSNPFNGLTARSGAFGVRRSRTQAPLSSPPTNRGATCQKSRILDIALSGVNHG
jgi:hypothetical protein